MKVYIAGPMTGLPKLNYPAFFAAEETLKKLGFEPVNPARYDVEHDGMDRDNPVPTHDRDYYYERDRVLLADCEGIVLITGWQKSPGVMEHELPNAVDAAFDIWTLSSNGDLEDMTSLEARDAITIYLQEKTAKAFEFSEVKDSGDRTKFQTGAVRDARAGKGRYDLLSPHATRRLAKHFENGAVKYGDHNFRKGMPLHAFLDSAIRHMFKLLEGANDEDHAAAAMWNVSGFIETQERIAKGELPNELNDLYDWGKK